MLKIRAPRHSQRSKIREEECMHRGKVGKSPPRGGVPHWKGTIRNPERKEEKLDLQDPTLWDVTSEEMLMMEKPAEVSGETGVILWKRGEARKMVKVEERGENHGIYLRPG